MTTHALLKRGGVALGSIGAAAILYRRLLRRPIINWGASDAEANARLPGDELLVEADCVATRAITIDACGVRKLIHRPDLPRLQRDRIYAPHRLIHEYKAAA